MRRVNDWHSLINNLIEDVNHSTTRVQDVILTIFTLQTKGNSIFQTAILQCLCQWVDRQCHLRRDRLTILNRHLIRRERVEIGRQRLVRSLVTLVVFSQSCCVSYNLEGIVLCSRVGQTHVHRRSDSRRTDSNILAWIAVSIGLCDIRLIRKRRIFSSLEILYFIIWMSWLLDWWVHNLNSLTQERIVASLSRHVIFVLHVIGSYTTLAVGYVIVNWVPVGHT